MKNEVRPITITALDHCRARVTSCRGREMVVENIMVTGGAEGTMFESIVRDAGRIT